MDWSGDWSGNWRGNWSELLSSRGARLSLKAGGIALVLAVLGVAGWLWLRAAPMPD